MTFWAIQCILVWTRFANLFQRYGKGAILVQMIYNMIGDILNFLLVLTIFMVGFVFAINFIGGEDIEGTTHNFFSGNLYIFQTLLAQQEWDNIGSTAYVDAARSTLLIIFIVLFSIIGSVLLLNLLIALMASTYDAIKDNAQTEANFNVVSHTVELSQRKNIMPPPFNVFLWSIVLLIAFLRQIGKLVNKCCHICKCEDVLEKIVTNRTRKYSIYAKLEKKRNPDTYEFQYMNSAIFNLNQKNVCTYCKNIMEDYNSRGDIEDYFEYFESFELLDESDKHRIRNMVIDKYLCSHCYRPYKSSKSNTNRLYQREILIELLSYFAFMILVCILRIVLAMVKIVFDKLHSILHSCKCSCVGDTDKSESESESHFTDVENYLKHQRQINFDVNHQSFESIRLCIQQQETGNE